MGGWSEIRHLSLFPFFSHPPYAQLPYPPHSTPTLTFFFVRAFNDPFPFFPLLSPLSLRPLQPLYSTILFLRFFSLSMQKGEKRVCDVVFGDTCHDNQFRMLQGDPALLKLLGNMAGSEVVLKGSARDDANGVVLCTEDSTYEMTVLETTNTCMLTQRHDNVDEDKRIVGMVEETHVVKRIPHKAAEPLSALLDHVEARVAGSDRKRRKVESAEGSMTAAGFHSTDSLVPLLQASKAEICDALNAAPNIVSHEGAWRKVISEHTEECLETFIRIGDAEMNLAGFTEDEALKAMAEYHDPLAIKAVVKKYCKKAAEGLFAVDLRKIALARAEQLFVVSEEWDLAKFMKEWESCCPHIVTPSEEMLLGHALIENGSVAHFPSESLSLNPETRFESMFRQQKRWSEADMTEYITPLIGPGIKREQLLSRFTREFPINGKKTYVEF